jgi:hypothetical protein
LEHLTELRATVKILSKHGPNADLLTDGKLVGFGAMGSDLYVEVKAPNADRPELIYVKDILHLRVETARKSTLPGVAPINAP